MKTPIPDGWLPVGTILAGEYGSTAYGVQSQSSDVDVIAVYVEPRRFVTGVQRYNGERHSSAGTGNRSGSDDIDVTVHGLRKFAVGAGDGNPNMYIALFLPDFEVLDSLGLALTENKDLFFSRHVPARFLGYMKSQRSALLGQRGGAPQRPHLVEEFGFDVKYAYHMVRLGWQGLEACRTGNITMPFAGEQLRYLRDIRSGNIPLEDILALSLDIEADLQNEVEHGGHRPEADWDGISMLTDSIYEAAWEKFPYQNDAARHVEGKAGLYAG